MTTETKHTPAPWKVYDQTSNHKIIFADLGEAKRYIADVVCASDLEHAKNDLANARLIAAAPELLALAKATMDYTLSREELVDLACAAIAKAEGR